MQISCDCGNFKAELLNFPKNTPGRLVCYCDDCQSYAKKIGREDILDPYGGTQVVPVYPNDFKILQGEEFLQCNRLKERGLSRWTVTCCNSPIANTLAKFPWVGIPHTAFTKVSEDALEKIGPIRSRVKGKYKTSEAEFKISEDMGIKDMLVVGPFVLKGMLFKKYNQSPFFEGDFKTPSRKPVIL